MSDEPFRTIIGDMIRKHRVKGMAVGAASVLAGFRPPDEPHHAIYFMYENEAGRLQWRCEPCVEESTSLVDLIEHMRADDLPYDVITVT